MAKLIIDQDSLAALFTKLQSKRSQPIYWGPDEKMLAPGLIELDGMDSNNDKWQPYSERTRLLVLGVDACRDIMLYTDQLIEHKTRQRVIRGVVVPICKLIDAVLQLIAKMNDEQSRNIRETWPRQDQSQYRKIVKHLKKVQYKSSVRYIRNKLGAHLDPKVFDGHIPHIDLSDILSIFANAIVLLMLSMNYPSQWFSWIRFVENLPHGKHRAVETMLQYPVSVRWITDLNGHMKEMERMTVAEDPRHDILTQLFEATDSYNKMLKETDVHLSFVLSEP